MDTLWWSSGGRINRVGRRPSEPMHSTGRTTSNRRRGVVLSASASDRTKRAGLVDRLIHRATPLAKCIYTAYVMAAASIILFIHFTVGFTLRSPHSCWPGRQSPPSIHHTTRYKLLLALHLAERDGSYHNS